MGADILTFAFLILEWGALVCLGGGNLLLMFRGGKGLEGRGEGAALLKLA